MNDDIAAITAANRAAWDASAPLHQTGPYWEDLKTGFATPGYSRFDATITEALTAAGVNGARVVQIGCNNGRELLSTFALGAAFGLGIDQSRAFLDQAQILQGISGHNAQFLCADIYDLPADTATDFDLAFITIGVLNWMPDLARFFSVVARVLRPGGQLVIYETHPFLEMFDPASDAPFTPAYSYFRTRPFVESMTITYDGTDAPGAPDSHWFIHPLGQIVTAAITAGLTLSQLTEYPQSIREVAYDKYQDQPAQLPLSYLLRAAKPYA